MGLLITIFLWLLLGALIGWVAGLIMKSKNTLLWNIIFGIVGSIVGGLIASLALGRGGGLTGPFSFDPVSILISIGGACLVIFLFGLLRKKK